MIGKKLSPKPKGKDLDQLSLLYHAYLAFKTIKQLRNKKRAQEKTQKAQKREKRNNKLQILETKLDEQTKRATKILEEILPEYNLFDITHVIMEYKSILKSLEKNLSKNRIELSTYEPLKIEYVQKIKENSALLEELKLQAESWFDALLQKNNQAAERRKKTYWNKKNEENYKDKMKKVEAELNTIRERLKFIRNVILPYNPDSSLARPIGIKL